MISLQQENRNVKKVEQLTTGTRVEFSSSNTGEMETGTVVGTTTEVDPRGHYSCPKTLLICSDEYNAANQQGTLYTGEGHGVVVDPCEGGITSIQPDGMWHLVPAHVGVYAFKSFNQDGRLFKKGTTGRILRTHSDGHMAHIQWNAGRPGDLTFNWTDKAGNKWNHVWVVPVSYLRMCNLTDRRDKVVWPAGIQQKVGTVFKVGDLALLPANSVNCTDRRGKTTATLPPGTVVELLSNYTAGDILAWECKIAGGSCEEPFLGVVVKIKESSLSPVEDPERFFRPNQMVEITAEVGYRDTPLKGRKGRVVLGTDEDGDVGVELDTDIGAGSLDGAGKQGYCIYIGADALGSSE
jgi:hypothetical protein